MYELRNIHLHDRAVSNQIANAETSKETHPSSMHETLRYSNTLLKHSKVKTLANENNCTWKREIKDRPTDNIRNTDTFTSKSYFTFTFDVEKRPIFWFIICRRTGTKYERLELHAFKLNENTFTDLYDTSKLKSINAMSLRTITQLSSIKPPTVSDT